MKNIKILKPLYWHPSKKLKFYKCVNFLEVGSIILENLLRVLTHDFFTIEQNITTTLFDYDFLSVSI